MSQNLPQHPTVHPFEFHGKSGEFFKIWIVNICLTVLTLGIYSAWAKVRTSQYFYGHTTLAGSSFEYTAKPMTILKGRLVAVFVIILYSLSTSFFPLVTPLFIIAFLIILPWLICRSLKFRAVNSRYRNLNFNFHGTYGQAFCNYLLFPLLSVFTLYLIYPLIIAIQNRWYVNNSSYGQTKFTSNLSAKPIFFACFIAALVLIVAFTGFFGLVLGGNLITDFENDPLAPFLGMALLPVYYGVYVYVHAKVINATMNSTKLDQHGFESNLKASKLLWLLITNTLAIMVSFGLLIPWTHIRMARYKAECTQFIATGNLDEFTRDAAGHQNALGEELGDVMDLEFGI